MSRCAGSLALLVALCTTVLPTPADAQSMSREKRAQAAQVNAQLALSYMKQGNLQAAREKIDKALDQDPRTADTQMIAGFVYDRLGQDRKAADHFDRSVKYARDNPDVLNNAATYMCRKGSKKRGEGYFLQAASSPFYRTPEIAYVNAGRCARADERPKDAEKYFRQALALRPNLPDPLLQLADLFHATGDGMQARAFMQRYNDVAPATASSLWLGYRIETSLGDRAAAAEYARRLKADFATAPETGLMFDAERAVQ
jgi:type IV pilus assembly protein PilF